MLPAKQPSRAVRKRDGQIRRFVRRIQRIAPVLADSKFVPGLRAYAMTTLLLERAYAELRDKPLISPQTNEIRASVDVVRRLAETQKSLARELCLTPEAAVSLAKPVAVLDLESYRDDEKSD